ncbi:AMP-binding protein [Streptomyces sp. NBC_01233]|uniref:AMP-binding protein n=1 Tax=Streptomyces sp. NBC_01233 TaxID=2903787 RepID=UPI002E13DD2E|nr:AMP-binding protein [Streptomyces sp. NBC_01233]
MWNTADRAANRDRIALVEDATGRTYTYAALRRAIDQTALWLSRRGLRPGDAVALAAGNSYEMIAAYHGILAAGGLVLSLDPLGTPDEWSRALRTAGPRSAILAKDVWQKLRGLHAAAHLTAVMTIDAESAEDDRVDASVTRWSDILVDASPPIRWQARSWDQPALAISSSGTEGLPKQVLLTHSNLVVNLAQINVLHRLQETDVVLGMTPFRHIYGMQMAMNPTLRAGGTLVTVSTPFSAADFIRVVEQHRVTVAYVVPTTIAELFRCADAAGPALASLRLIFSGGAPLDPVLAEDCAARFGVTIAQGYGMTELGCACITPDGNPGPSGSVGVPLPGCEVRVVDAHTGLEAAPGSEGEVIVRGPQVSPGYLGDPQATAKLLDKDGWLRTGDLATRHPSGHLTITGRLKQLIKYKGHQIAPAELEAVLLTHPNVRDAAVVGEPDDVAGELPKAYVVLRSDVPLESLQSYVASRVAPYKKIRLIEQMDVIPRSAMGKVLTAELAAAAREGEK